MGDNSRIEWTDATWNPVVGCTRVSGGCDNCYAVRETKRLAGRIPVYQGLVNPGKDHFNGVIRTIPERLDQPLRWKRPRRIFVNSMSDLFHREVPDEFIAAVFAVMLQAQQHTFQILTKRPDRMAEVVGRLTVDEAFCELMYEEAGGDPDLLDVDWPLPNVHLGTSVEDQATADERIPHLLRTPAAVRFLSCEPLLGPVDLRRIPSWHPGHFPEGSDALRGGSWGDPFARQFDPDSPGYCNHSDAPTIHQVIVGGESGPNARPMHPDWARALRDQCQAAGVAFHFKQWGEWAPHTVTPGGDLGGDVRRGHVRIVHPGAESIVEVAERTNGRSTLPGSRYMARVGKKRAGRELDGRTWDEEPIHHAATSAAQPTED